MRRRWSYFWAQDYACEPAEIPGLLQLTPSSVWIARQTVLSNGRLAPVNAWRLESTLGDDEPLDAHIEDVLSKVTVHLTDLRAHVQPLTVGLNCVAYFAEYQGNGFHLSADMITRLAAHELSIDFDLYGVEGS